MSKKLLFLSLFLIPQSLFAQDLSNKCFPLADFTIVQKVDPHTYVMANKADPSTGFLFFTATTEFQKTGPITKPVWVPLRDEDVKQKDFKTKDGETKSYLLIRETAECTAYGKQKMADYAKHQAMIAQKN